MRKMFLIFIIVLNFLTVAHAISIKKEHNNILVISDIHLNKFSTHTMEISPAGFNKDNDLDLKTYTKLINSLGDSILADNDVAKPSAILVLGDIVGHNQTPEQVQANEKEVFTQVNQLSKRIGNVPLLYVFGNNDSLIANYGPFQTKDTQQSVYQVAQSTGWVDGFLSTGTQCGKKTKFPCILTEDKINGYYAVFVQPKLRMIALNSVMFSPRRTQGVAEEDAIKQLKWFEAQIKEAATHQDSVLIAMHIPAGHNVFDHSVFWEESDEIKFLQIINDYQKNIIGIVTSHTHMEEMKVIKDSAKKNIAPILFVPGLSTSHGNMPAAKTFYYAKGKLKNWVLTNTDTLQFSEHDGQIVLNKLYDYREFYCTGKSKDIINCLNNFNVEKMKKYFSVGNKNFEGDIKSPEDIYITI
jgi:predicted phosphodiesterase